MFKQFIDRLMGAHRTDYLAQAMVYPNRPTTLESISNLYDFMGDQEPIDPLMLSNFRVYEVLNEISFWATREEARATGLTSLRETRRMMYDENVYVFEASYREYCSKFRAYSKTETFYDYLEREIKPLYIIIDEDASKFSKIITDYEIAMNKVLNVVRDNVRHNGYLEDSVRVKATEIFASFGHDVNARIKEIAREEERLRQATNEGHVAQLDFELKHINAFIKGEGLADE